MQTSGITISKPDSGGKVIFGEPSLDCMLVMIMLTMVVVTRAGLPPSCADRVSTYGRSRAWPSRLARLRMMPVLVST